jgi:hypothetical protein
MELDELFVLVREQTGINRTDGISHVFGVTKEDFPLCFPGPRGFRVFCYSPRDHLLFGRRSASNSRKLDLVGRYFKELRLGAQTT